MNEKIFSPKEFYKKKYPDFFSDSKINETISIDKNILSYTLETVTANNLESNFQSFCVELVKREICPNISPQTGPTGGGDGKADAETYPISDSLLLFGQPKESSNERWAFAISAKKEWKGKAKDDFQKIIDTKREYSKIFYISNQFISDRKKRELEDEFAKNNSQIRFVILDKQWLIDKAVNNKNKMLLKDFFDFKISTTNEIGPKDYARNQRLIYLNDKYVKTNILKEKIGISTDIIKLSRELEIEKKEMLVLIDNYFSLAEQFDSQREKFDALYVSAWTMYWWYEDYTKYYEYYCRIENIFSVIDASTPQLALYYYELINNLWLNLHAIFFRFKLNIDFNKHTMFLVKEYEKVRDDETKSNLWICLKPYYYKMQLLMNINECTTENFNSIDNIFSQFAQAILDAKNQPDFNATAMLKIFLMSSEEFSIFTDYDLFYDKMLDLKVEREGQLIKAKAVLERCPTLFKQNKNYKVIEYLGKVFSDFNKEESHFEYISALSMMGSAFRHIGLDYAARQYFFASLCEGLDYLSIEKKFHPSTKYVIKHLKDIEVLIGQFVYASQLNSLDLQLGTYCEDDNNPPFELFLAGLLLRTPPILYQKLSRFSGYLNENNLLVPEIILKRMLGYYDEEFNESNKNVIDKLIEDTISQPFYKQLKWKPIYGFEEDVALASKILGCNTIINTKNKGYLLEYSSNVLGGVEAFLSTYLENKHISIKSSINIIVDFNSSEDFDFSYNVEKQAVIINCPKKDDIFDRNFQEKLQKNFFAVIMFISMIIFDDKRILDKQKIDESILKRSFFPFSLMHKIKNTFGANYFSFPKCDAYEEFKPNENAFSEVPKPTYTAYEAPVNIGNFELNFDEHDIEDSKVYRHDSIIIDDLINVELWDKAIWKAAIYMHFPDNSESPILLLGFENIEYGNKIFAEWINKYGRMDSKKVFKIEIIKGVDKKKPFFYRMAIGKRLSSISVDNDMIFGYKSRNITMQPTSLKNLDAFERRITDKFYFAPVDMDLIESQRMDNDKFNYLMSTYSLVLDNQSISIRWIKDILNPDMLVYSSLLPTDNPDLDETHPVQKFINQKRKHEKE